MPLARVVHGQPRDLGHNFRVARVLPQLAQRAVGPFVFLDHMGPLTLPPGQGFDVRPHPHIGLATATFLYAGAIMHRDSVGAVQVIRPDELNLMTAGRGITHSERATPEGRAAGGPVHGLQFWLALPLADEECPPRFEHRAAEELPRWTAPGAAFRLILGRAAGRASPAVTHGDPLLVDLALDAGATIDAALDGPDDPRERALYIASGEIELAGERHGPGALLVANPGVALPLRAITAARIALVGGAPLDGPRHLDWNFVSSSKERLAQAKDDWRSRRFPTIPDDDLEFIPLP
jgi:redox-sensitive bicupin YhaK (pirin superfamily)